MPSNILEQITAFKQTDGWPACNLYLTIITTEVPDIANVHHWNLNSTSISEPVYIACAKDFATRQSHVIDSRNVNNS